VIRRNGIDRNVAAMFGSMLCFLSSAFASNPIINTAYSADPSAHVFNDRMYVYASHDRNDAREFDMIDYHVYSSSDLRNWRDHGIAFRLADSTWAKSHLWAPDCAYKNGNYYLYYPAQDASGRPLIGVAISHSPSGPFVDTKGPIARVHGIDPALFVDDDGTPYLIWADGGAKIARLKPSMKELAESPHMIDGATDFFEGPWIFHRNGHYYLTYPAFKAGGVGRGGHGQNYDYAISEHPEGPYVYEGPFTQSGPGGDNIHGSQVEWKGKWYCFYHDFSTSVGHENQGYKRAVKMDLMDFSPDGLIRPLQWTTSGPVMLHPIDAYSRIEAETMNRTDVPEGDHAITTSGDSSGVVYLGPALPGAWVEYAGVDLHSGANTFYMHLASATGGGVVDLYLDRIGGPVAASCTVRYTGGWDRWTTQSCATHLPGGVHDLYLVFRGEGQSGLLNLDWFRFSN